MLLASAFSENKLQLRCLQKTRCQIGSPNHTSHTRRRFPLLLSSSFNWIWRRSVQRSNDRLKQSGVQGAVLFVYWWTGCWPGQTYHLSSLQTSIKIPVLVERWSLSALDLHRLVISPPPACPFTSGFIFSQVLFCFTASLCFRLPSGCHLAFLCFCRLISHMELVSSLGNGKNELTSRSRWIHMCVCTFWLENKTLSLCCSPC